MKFLLSALTMTSMFSFAFAQDSCDVGKMTFELTIMLEALTVENNAITVLDLCTGDLVLAIEKSQFSLGDNTFSACIEPLQVLEINFEDFLAPLSMEEEGDDLFEIKIEGVTIQTGGTGAIQNNMMVEVLHGNPESCFATTDGDPHFKTWSGKTFDFHGQCDLVLLEHPEFNNGQGLDIHARTHIRYQYSFIQTAAVKIGEDTMELTGFGEYSINGVSSAQLPTTLGGQFVVSKIAHAHHDDKNTHMYEIVIPEKGSIKLKSFKDMVGVSLSPILAGDFKGIAGIMGSSVSVDFQARDGSVMDDSEAFAFEWQVHDTDPKIFTNMDHKPQWPAKCMMPTTSAEERRRLGEQIISYETAKKACEVAGRASDIEMCIYDVIATSDLELANAGAF